MPRTLMLLPSVVLLTDVSLHVKGGKHIADAQAFTAP